MNRRAYLDAITREGDAFLAAARTGDLSARVPSCPDWSLADLVWHLGEVHWFWACVVEERLQDIDGFREPPRPPDGELVAFAVDARARLERTLAATDPATAVWTWAPPHDVAFVVRRQAQETLVHRWDAELAIGATQAMDPELALDGVDEFVTVMMPHGGGDSPPIGGRVALVGRGSDETWIVSDGPDALTSERGPGVADATATADPAQLLLALWRRVPIDALDIDGDRDLVARLLAHTAAD